MRRNLVITVQIVSLLAAIMLVACGGARIPPHTGIFIERDGTFVELDRASMSFADSSIDPLPTFQISDERPLLIVYTPGESPSDLHMFRIERRPVEEIPINITPKGSDVVHVQPQQELVAGSYVIMHGEGSIFENTPCWGFVVGPVETGEVVATPSVPSPTPTPGIGPVLLWEDEFDSLSIADSTVYIADHIYETDRNIVKARDLETGQQLWLKDDWDVGGEIFAVNHGLVYIEREDKRIYALEASSGQEVWKFKFGPNDFINGPMVEGNTIYFGLYVWSESADAVGAIDALTGELKWMDKGPYPNGCGGYHIGAVFEGYSLVVCKAFREEIGRVLDAAGQVAWRARELLGCDEVHPLAQKDGVLFVQAVESLMSCDREDILAVDFATGQIIRNYGFKPNVATHAVIYGDTLFLQDLFARRGEAVAIDLSSADEKWRWDVASLGPPVWASNGTAYLHSPDLSTLTAVDNASGQILWENDEIHGEFRTRYMESYGMESYGKDIVGTEEVVLCGPGRTLYGLDARTGETIWKIKDTPSLYLHTFIRGSLLFSTGDGVELLDPMTGETLWSSAAIKGASKAIQKDSLLVLQSYDKLWVLKMP